MWLNSITCLGLLALGVVRAQENPASLGLFESQNDIGQVLHSGSAEFDDKTKTYRVTGSGDNMWVATDEFHFVWKKVSADDVALSADISILGADGDGHRKGLLMIRQSLDQDSAYVDAARHGEGLTSLQFREQKGGVTREVESNISGPKRLRIEKRGDRFYMWIAQGNQNFQFAGGSARVEIKAPFYVGIGVCAHNKDATLTVAFTNLQLETKASSKKQNYSTLENVIARSTDARVGYVSRKHLKSAGWSDDGKSLTFVSAGKPQTVPFEPLTTAAPVGTPMNGQPETKYRYFVSEKGGHSAIWRKPKDGSQPEQLTSDDSNDVSPHVSPDGGSLVFLSFPRESKNEHKPTDIELKLMSLADHKVKTLAMFVGSLDSLGPEPWSPDGRRVAFISYQTRE